MTPPAVDWDMFSDEVLADPYLHYQGLRDLGPVVRIEQYDVLAITRWRDVRETLRDWRTFTNTKGVAFNASRNEALQAQSVLFADPPEHKHLRDNLMRWLSPKRVRAYQEQIEQHAEILVDDLVARGSFDAVTDYAEALPAKVVGELVGLPTEMRRNLIPWGEATFNAAGPDNERMRAGTLIADHVWSVLPTISRDDVDPGSTAYEILTMVEEGTLSRDDAVRALANLSAASLDTTIGGIATAIHQLALDPEQWDAVRADPSLVVKAGEEALRFEAPAQVFSRVANADCKVDGTAVQEGDRVAVYFGSANRDERHYAQPDVFDVHRGAKDHMAFGHGLHHCAGAELARIEMCAAIGALTRRVKRLDVGAPERRPNNITRRLSSLPASIDR